MSGDGVGRRHSSRIKRGDSLARWIKPGAAKDDWALEMFHEMRVRGKLW